MAQRRPDPLSKLARAIESLSERDEERLRLTSEVEELRPRGGRFLFDLCREFVDSVNTRLSRPDLVLDPAIWPEGFLDGAMNLIQINLRGRILQLEFRSTDVLISTEDFRKPYVLEGAVRSFNQELLEMNRIEEKQIFFCRKKDAGVWYFADRRYYVTGRVDQEFLIREFERLL